MDAAASEIEKKMLVGLQQGNKEAFAYLYEKYKHRLAANLVRLLHSDELAQDILQDLFLKIWETRHLIDPQQSFRSYLFRIAENMVVDIYRKAAREKALQQQLFFDNSQIYSHIEEAIIREENIVMVRRVIAQLPSQQQKVFTLFKIEGKSYQEISDELGLSLSTINKHIYNANKFVSRQIAAVPIITIPVITSLFFSEI